MFSFFRCFAPDQHLHSFPTRRSSDLKRRGCLTVPRLTLMSLIKMMLIRVSLRSEERFSRNAETDLVCRLEREKKEEDHLEEQSGHGLRHCHLAGTGLRLGA